MARIINEEAEINVTADGAILFNVSNDVLTLQGRMDPEATLRLSRQVLELHKAREALAAENCSEGSRTAQLRRERNDLLDRIERDRRRVRELDALLALAGVDDK